MKNRLSGLKVAAAVLGFCLAFPDAHANSVPVPFYSLTANATVPTALLAGDDLLVNTLVTSGQVGPLQQTISFTLGAGVTSFTGGAAWEVTSAGPRLVGVNIDILDAANHVVASDTFAGNLGGFAVSSFAGNLGPGAYRLVASGTGVRDSSLDISLSFAGASAPLDVVSSVTQPVYNNHLQATTTLYTPFLSGDTLFADTLVINEPGALNQRFAFTVGAGVFGFTGAASWEATAAAGAGPRLTDVNIDILDAANNVVATDTFDGTLGSFGLSSLVGNLGPGSHVLVATGTAVRDASLNVSLTFGAAGLPDPVTPVPEPQTIGLTLLGLGVMGVVSRGRRVIVHL